MSIRPYNQGQMFLLPPSLDEWVRPDHPARVFSEVIDRIDTSEFRESKDEGRPAYHPTMMLKVLLWGYATGVRSSRKIHERLQQDIVCMWLAGMERPGFRTLAYIPEAGERHIGNTTRARAHLYGKDPFSITKQRTAIYALKASHYGP